MYASFNQKAGADVKGSDQEVIMNRVWSDSNCATAADWSSLPAECDMKIRTTKRSTDRMFYGSGIQDYMGGRFTLGDDFPSESLYVNAWSWADSMVSGEAAALDRSVHGYRTGSDVPCGLKPADMTGDVITMKIFGGGFKRDGGEGADREDEVILYTVPAEGDIARDFAGATTVSANAPTGAIQWDSTFVDTAGGMDTVEITFSKAQFELMNGDSTQWSICYKHKGANPDAKFDKRVGGRTCSFVS